MTSVSQQRLFVFGHMYDSNGQEYIGRYGSRTKSGLKKRFFLKPNPVGSFGFY